MERQHLDEALAAMMELVRAANGYAESQAPWALNKAGETERLGQVLAAMAETCRIAGPSAGTASRPAPRAAARAARRTPPYDERGTGGPGLDALTAWGGGPADWRTGAATPLFPRVELEVAV